MIKTNYKDFLQDTDFITWRLTNESHLEVYWQEYIQQHPALKEEFDRAIREFAHIQLNKQTLSDTEYNYLLEQIHTSAQHLQQKKRKLRILSYAAAACVLVLSAFSLLYSMNEQEEEFNLLSEDLIVGENLEEQEISLITDSQTTSFSKDVNVHIKADGSAVVQEIGEEVSTRVKTAESKMNKLVVPYGKRSQLTLSDGTRVWVNSGSVLEFPSVFTGKTREVNLVGEMYVEVAKDKQKAFIVNTSEFQAKVYGTQFNISAYRDNCSQSVVLVEGSVGIKTSAKEETRLLPNDRLQLIDNKWTKEQVDVSRYISWKEGYIVLKNTSIVDVLKQVERYYNLTFNIPESNKLDALTCTGKIYLSDDLDNVMHTVSLLSSTRYKRENKTIYIDINP
ncbi:FecR family protein [Parabacteroides sp. 52]|uniref:FecR family protein n=1 Tax=unclassified Parabacteroides TaxID=2649774 RepID=UPI0013D40FF0|nr:MULTISPECIES: FecR family protein [unclassified Parabacteroides]MDH6534643.1 transmembrane sensor [Parabacteroides sp. PM5-20]NDV56111.1 FecR family protein [Parabacteroides sp. 52]